MAPPASLLSPTTHHSSHMAFPADVQCRLLSFDSRCGSSSSTSRPTSSSSIISTAAAAAASGYTASVSSFEDLVQAIRTILGPSSGLDSEGIDVKSIMSAMREYDPGFCQDQWRRYALADPSRSYTRNGVDECNEKANLLILVWNPRKGSMIHDHANAHCVMKILQGSLVETLYEWPEQDEEETGDLSGHREESTMKIKKETTLNTGDVAYMSDTLGLHRMSNPSSDQLAISLHLYTPPHAAKFGCMIFEEQSGRRHHVKMSTLYSDHGVLVCDKNHNSC